MTPEEIHKLYEEGLQGVIYDEEMSNAFLSSLPIPFFSQVNTLFGDGKGKLSLPWKAAAKFHPEFGNDESQTTGDCLSGDTLVRMASGKQKKISEISIGEYVVSQNNEKRRVNAVIKKKYTGEIIRLHMEKMPFPIEVTPDHKFDTYPDIERILNDGGTRHVTTHRRLAIEAGRLKEKNVLCASWGLDNKYSRNITIDLLNELKNVVPDGISKVSRVQKSKSVNRFIEMDSDFCWLYGIFLAEGSCKEHSIQFSLSIHEMNFAIKISRIIKNVFGINTKIFVPKSRDDVTIVECHSVILADFFRGLTNGNVYDKSIDERIFSLKEEERISCLKGWLDGDGHLNLKERKNKKGFYYKSIVGVSVSENLIKDMYSLALSCKFRASIVIRKQEKHQRKPSMNLNFYGPDVDRLYPEQCEALKHQVQIKHKNKSDVMTHGMGLKIRNIEKFYVEDIDVYCLEVDIDHQFQGNFINLFNCVSHGNRNALDITRCTEILEKGEKEIYVARGATEGIYGCRGHGGQGMQGYQAAEFLSKNGGLLIRQNYTEINLDLSKYNAEIGIRWGSRGIPESVLAEARKHQVQTASLVTEVEGARDLIANGYGIAVCSNYGFSSARDKFGIAEARGTWNHCYLEDTIISSPDKNKSIKDYNVGDRVFDHNGDIQNVTNLFSREYEGEIIKISSYGLPTFKVTSEHPILVYREIEHEIEGREEIQINNILVIKKHKQKTKARIKKWIEAKDIRLGDWLLTPKVKYEKENIEELSFGHLNPSKMEIPISYKGFVLQLRHLLINNNQCPLLNLESDYYVMTISEESENSTFFYNGYYCNPVRKITTQVENCKVYNLEVSNSHTYIADGVASHNCMTIGGVDDTRKRSNELLFLILNSWGPNWISGEKFEQPDGSFWIREHVMAAMLAQKQTYVFSNFNGFRKKMAWKIKDIYA